jgi:hypothetical protein
VATSPAWSQEKSCKESLDKLTAAQAAQVKSAPDAAARFLALKIGADMKDADKRKAYFADYCRSENLAKFDSARSDVNAAIEAATNAEALCPEGKDREDAVAVHKQYETLKAGITKISSTASEMCRIALHDNQ